MFFKVISDNRKKNNDDHVYEVGVYLYTHAEQETRMCLGRARIGGSWKQQISLGIWSNQLLRKLQTKGLSTTLKTLTLKHAHQ